MNDEYVTTDPFFAAAMMCFYGKDSLLKIETETQPFRPNEVRIEMSVPSFDAAEYQQEFKNGMLAIPNFLEFVKCYSQITNVLRQMRRDGEQEWVSNSWISGVGK